MILIDIYTVITFFRGFCIIPVFDLDRSPPIDPQVLHTLESIVIEWSHQVRDVLIRDSSEPLAQGLSPLPSTEIKFWSDRYTNLKCIYEQVSIDVKYIIQTNIVCAVLLVAFDY